MLWNELCHGCTPLRLSLIVAGSSDLRVASAVETRPKTDFSFTS